MKRILGAGVSVFALATLAVAEDTQSLTVRLGAQAGRNLDLTAGGQALGSSYSTVLSYVGQSSTPTLTFGYDAETEVAGETAGLPSGGLSVGYQGARTTVSFDARLDQQRVSDLNYALNSNGSVVAYRGQGVREVTSTGLSFSSGQDTPVRFSFDVGRTEIGYRDTVSTDFYGSVSRSLTGAAIFDFTSMTSASAQFSYSDYVADNLLATQRQSRSIVFGLSQRIDAITSATLTVGETSLETGLGGVSVVSDGPSLSAGLVRERQTGEVGLEFSRDLTATGQRQSLELSAKREAQSNALSGSFGVTKGAAQRDWIGALTYGAELPRQDVSLSLSRQVTVDDDNQDVLSTSLVGRLQHEFTQADHLNLSVGFSSFEETASQTDRLDMTVSYDREMAQDVHVTAGLSYRFAAVTGEADGESQAVFLRISKEFDTSR